MKKLVLTFIMFTIMLFAGIFIMIKPSAFVTQPVSFEPAQDNSLVDTDVPRIVILVGSFLIIIGLVGLSILGFKVYKESETTTRVP